MARELRFIVIKEIWCKLRSFTNVHSCNSGLLREGALKTSCWMGEDMDFLYGSQGKYIEAIEICWRALLRY